MESELKTKYEYIYFTKVARVEDKPKTSVWRCRNRPNNGLLGEVKWYSNWRQYCFFPEPNTIFNKSCLEDINHFIGQLR